jgi:translation initiation factor IF-3
MAMEAGMDLVEISPNTNPPVCKIMDYGKFKYSAHQEIGTKLLDKVKSDVAEIAKVEQDARFEGRQVVMVLAPR